MSNYKETYNEWLNSPRLSPAEKQELEAISSNETEIKNRFYSGLSFGTAGLRGKMMTGWNAMNVYTVAQATAGLAELILKEGRASDGVVIAYDSRNQSELFSKTAASVLADYGIPVTIFDSLRPTPELSFAVRELHCVAGINITASHNPKEYNGYKAYWEDGAQISPEQAAVVSAEIEKKPIFSVRIPSFDEMVASGRITIIGKEFDEKYLAAVLAQQVNRDLVPSIADELKIVYSPLHGAGYRMVPEMMKRIGVRHIYPVEEQMVIDGNFPTVKKPNPEYPDVFTLGIRLADKVGSDLIIATDPDADRVGVMARCKDGTFSTITGNQMGALLMDYIISAYKETGTMPPEPYAVKSIVSSEMVTKICEENGVRMFNVLTGFKFIGEVIKNHESEGHGSFLFGFEESYGYLKGTYARDKDSVVAAMLICEMTAYYKKKNMTLMDALAQLFDRYGYYYEATAEFYMEGLDGKTRMESMMNSLRQDPKRVICGLPVRQFADYKTQTILDYTDGSQRPTGLTKSNVLSYVLSNRDTIIVRPSGTEPKIKLYYLLTGKDKEDTVRKKEAYQKEFTRTWNL